MSNNPILPIIPNDAEESNEDENTDSRATVDKDVREADAANEKIDE